jgi:triosephosphate isomerase (TIM)
MNKYIIGNLKMNLLSPAECNRYLADFNDEIRNLKLKGTEIILCPPYIYLEKFINNFKRKKGVKIGAQNAFWEKEGAYTGEISIPMLKNLGCEYIILGHSERRRYFGETNETVNLKIKAVLKLGITPVYCVGESKEERRMNLTKEVVINQIQEGFQDIPRVNLEKIIIAYEPIWSIGTNIVPESNEIMEAKLLIRKILTEKYGSKYALMARIIYGGSVNSKIADKVCLNPEMDGVLVGRESLIPHELIKIATLLNG